MTSKKTIRRERTLPVRSASKNTDDATVNSNVLDLAPLERQPTLRNLELPTVSAEAEQLEAEQPGAEQSEPEQPEPEQPEPEQPEAEQPEAEQPEAERPEAEQLEAGAEQPGAELAAQPPVAPRPDYVRRALKVLVWVAVSPLLAVLPVVIALRISVGTYQQNVYNGWESLAIGVLWAMVLVCVSIVVFMLSFGIRRRFFLSLLNMWLTAVLCYTGYALFYLSSANAKTTEVQSYYASLHPLLRVGVKNLAIVDRDLVITDVHRTKAEYQAMGLQPRDYSLHFRQSTGFVHAVDLRTKDRSKIKNLLIELYFVLMGFETIRHVGTADHLHVSLAVRENEQE